MAQIEQAVILSAVRTAIGKFMGGLAPLSATELGAKVVTESARRAALDSKQSREGATERRGEEFAVECIMDNVVQVELRPATPNSAFSG
jgi:acetyl-CoA acetyltransferase